MQSRPGSRDRYSLVISVLIVAAALAALFWWSGWGADAAARLGWF